MAYLLDTDWSIQALRGKPNAVAMLDRVIGGSISVSRITMAELYDGAYRNINPEAAVIALRDFLSTFTVLEVTDAVAEGFGALRAYLNRRGEKLEDLDIFIAATAIHHDLTLLTFNRKHFERVPGLRVYQP